MRNSLIGAFADGVLSANSLPHLAIAVTGRQLMTPLAGKDSGRMPNLIWSIMNLGAGLALAARTHRTDQPWHPQLIAYGASGATFMVWSVFAETVLKINTDS